MLQRKIILFIVIFILVITVLYEINLLIPFGKPGKEISVIITPGTSVRKIADLLKEKDVIGNVNLFLVWIKLNGLEKSMQAGRCKFYKYEGIVSAADRLDSAEPIEKQVTIPEGLIVEQTASCIRRVLPIDTVEFLRLCNDKKFIKEIGLDVFSLEGYLFPETYRFRPDVKSVDIIRTMVSQFFKEYNSIKPSPISTKFSRAEIVVLASIIEKEAKLSEEQLHIAGVFHNRLRINVPLGADPTVRYALKKFTGPLYVSELRNPSPYNTRVHAGLPPGPICSPGRGALQSAISPMETKDLYFVAKWDGSGAHYFSRNSWQHNRNKLKARKRKKNKRK